MISSISRSIRATATSSPAVAAFAEHLQRYLVVPSSRYADPGARKARGELTGCLLYDPPGKLFWEISQ